MRSLLLARKTVNKLSKKSVAQSLDHVVRRGLAGGRGSSWRCEIDPIKPQPSDDGWVSMSLVHFYKSRVGDPEVERTQWYKIYEKVREVGFSSRFNGHPWRIVGDQLSDITPDEPEEENKDKEIANISLERRDFFNRVYDLDAQIEVILSALEIAKKTEYKKRYNCLLFGPPGCAKSSLLEGVGNMLGEERQHYLRFNGTALTQAGIIKILDEASFVPPVLMIEEIEKCAEDELRWLLDLLDFRGEVRKTNFRVNIHKKISMLCLATVNNQELFNKRLQGALGSRFAHQIHFPYPSEETLRKILKREIEDIDGSHDWIEPTMEWAVEHSIKDPRRIIAICMCGRDKLLDGTYQKFLEKTSKPFDGEDNGETPSISII